MLGNFALHLAYHLQAEAKTANWHANDHYATTLYSSGAQDRAWAGCVDTARLCDLADDCAVEAEDNAWLAKNARAA
jgi:hypothetical protein